MSPEGIVGLVLILAAWLLATGIILYPIAWTVSALRRCADCDENQWSDGTPVAHRVQRGWRTEWLCDECAADARLAGEKVE